MESEVLVVWLGKNTKPVDTIILLAVADNNKPVSHKIGGDKTCKLSLNVAGIGLASDQMCDKMLLFIVPLTLHMFEFGVVYTLKYQKIS